ncbi:ParB/RepB/Spo0J family partition protein [Ralstonia insidiosa]|uniref:ParB/RepB/Spo0J family partition protein n=1 Tax=Ralstonia pickettii TaxID=329 RepID=A0AAW4QCE3_RALPI|nr:ParB/RepB/Spo0J family partition protein [Ralstonia insidiosa]MBX3755987.1 ParB/RepB/Spo0J family partition protein [Ralstonia pickettii]MBY4719606.1 ParB/RepB/Spo0J family partition protein [Ralstonia mannitolilytica]MCL6469257.1 ParB/RepB/Spo0J family partition protein [Ralstonia sp.]MBX3784600.1 ParB/RepB/Spo0J family partition protein [Ralstonia pickettii]
MQGASTTKGQPIPKLTLASGLIKGFKNEQQAIQTREREQEPPPASPQEQESQPVTETTANTVEPAAGPTASAVGGRKSIAIADCVSNPYNPRVFYPEAKIQELALTLQREGQIEAIKFTRLPQFPGKYVIIDGERRLRAKRSLGETHIDAEERHDVLPIDLYTTAYRANNDHERQSIFDDAIAWQQLIEQQVVADQNSLAEKVTKDKAYVSKVLSLNALPRAILERMAESADRVGLQAAYCLKLIFDRVGEEGADRHLTAVIEGKRTVRELELILRNLQGPGATAKRSRTRYHQLFDFKADGVQRGQLKTFPDGRISLELKEIPADKQEALAEKLKALVDQELVEPSAG